MGRRAEIDSVQVLYKKGCSIPEPYSSLLISLSDNRMGIRSEAASPRSKAILGHAKGRSYSRISLAGLDAD